MTRRLRTSCGHHPGSRSSFAAALPLVAPFDRSSSTTLRLSRSLELLDNRRIVLNLLVLVSPKATMGNYFTWESATDRGVAVLG